MKPKKCKDMWKQIKNYDNYSVSIYGDVMNIITGDFISKSTCSGGYYTVTLRNSDGHKTFRVHQLVAIAFLGHKPNGHKLVVDHIDGNKKNNHISNLQLITQRRNAGKGRGSSSYAGVSWNKQRQAWAVRFFNGKKNEFLGYFTNEIRAAEAYEKRRFEEENM